MSPPQGTLEAIDRFVENGIEPGDFLQAVLCNDLRGALACADETNRAALYEIVCYLHNEVPSACWGSRERYGAWLLQQFTEGNLRASYQDRKEAADAAWESKRDGERDERAGRARR